MIRNFDDFCRELNKSGFSIGGFGKEEKSRLDRAMVELQMGMFITMTGRQQKKNKYGIEYGWNSTVFTTVENFWAERGVATLALGGDTSREIAVRIPGAQLRMYDQWGHGVYEEARDFNRTVLDFLNSK